MDLTLWSLVLGAVVLLVAYFYNVYTFWSKSGVPCPKGIVPLIGHMLPFLTMKVNIGDFVNGIYYECKDASMVGIYKGLQPSLIVREPELVKNVLQVNFTSFNENALKIDRKRDSLLANNPFFNTGDTWMTGRKRLSYAFSSKKLKLLFETVQYVCKKFDDFLERRLKTDSKYLVELKYLFSKYTAEVVANAALGIEGFCFEDEPHPAAFDKMGKDFLAPNFWNGVAQLFVLFLPSLNTILNLRLIPKSVEYRFRKTAKDVLESRKKEAAPRNDFFQLMVELARTEGTKINENEITSHAFSFFVDGYETSSITLSFIAYQLAVHTDVQEKLRNEVKSVVAKHNNVLTYEALKEMTYMDQVFSESQRVYPAVGAMGKVCTQEVELEGSDGIRCRVKPGTEILIPTHGLQMDTKYWVNPEVFDPERFSEDRKQEIDRFTFIPFGEGPRMCVGMRMAILQMKACIATLLMKYKLTLSPKTRVPLKFSPQYFLSSPIGGIWVNIEKI